MDKETNRDREREMEQIRRDIAPNIHTDAGYVQVIKKLKDVMQSCLTR